MPKRTPNTPIERNAEQVSRDHYERSMNTINAINYHRVYPLMTTDQESHALATHYQWMTINQAWDLCASRQWGVEHFLWLCGLRGGRAERPPFQASPSFGRWKV